MTSGEASGIQVRGIALPGDVFSCVLQALQFTLDCCVRGIHQ